MTDDKYDGFDPYVTNEYIGNTTPLAAGESYTRNPTITIPAVTPGNYYLLFLTDNSHSQAEANENNNVRSVAVTVTPANLDLVVTGATGPASSPLGAIDVSWTVKNQGTDPAGGYWSDYVYLSTDDALDGSDLFAGSSFVSASPVIDGGSSYTRTLTVNLPNVAAGNYHLLFVADGSHSLSETDENNNTFALPITLSVPDVRPGRDGRRRPQLGQVRLRGRRLLDGDQPGERFDDRTELVRHRLPVDR